MSVATSKPSRRGCSEVTSPPTSRLNPPQSRRFVVSIFIVSEAVLIVRGQLIDGLDAALTFCIVEESKSSLDKVTNYSEVKAQIQSGLEEMRDTPKRTDNPLIYHLDVAAMYPNIMLSNRLQP